MAEPELVAGLEQDLEEMETLTAELLESERLNSRHANLNLSAEDPAALAQEADDLRETTRFAAPFSL